tara:strand:+ start:6321 stop:8375 length:2055 start_codon:yes stop_codon:yes gene_type:complete
MVTQKNKKKTLRNNRSKKQKGGGFLEYNKFRQAIDSGIVENVINTIENDNIDINKTIIQDVFIFDEDTALMYAYRTEKYDIAYLLLEKGADVNISGKDRNTMLMECIKKYIKSNGNDDLDMMNKVIESGAYVNAVNNYGKTPFMIAARAAAEYETKWKPEDEPYIEYGTYMNIASDVVKLLIEKYENNIKFIMSENIVEAITEWNKNSGKGTWVQYIPGDGIQDWDVSDVIDMSELFYNNQDFNDDISKWDVSNVTDMRGMFQFAASFNQDISQWNVSNVTDMAVMFQAADSFNQDLSNWDVDPYADMEDMFIDSGLIDENGDFLIDKLPQAFINRIGENGDFNNGDFYEEEEGEGEGIAYEIHNAFDKINQKRYIETINKYLTDLNEETPFFKDMMLLPTSTRENRQHIVREILRVSRIAFNEHIKDFAEPEKNNKQNAFHWVIQKFSDGEGFIDDREIMTIVLITFAYVWSSQWTDAERGNYIHTWITDNAEAYSSNRNAAANVSCTKGIFERVVQSLTMILAKNDINETQQTILNIINNVLPDMGEIFKLWVNNTDNDENIKTLIANAKTEENVFAFATSVDKKTLRDSFTEFAKNIYKEHGKTEEELMNDNAFTDYINGIDEYIQYGGRRYHKLKKNKSKRKSKTVNKNKKQKRKTQKKKDSKKKDSKKKDSKKERLKKK